MAYFTFAPVTFTLNALRNSTMLSNVLKLSVISSSWSALCISTRLALQQDAHFSKSLALSNSDFLVGLLSLPVLEANDSSALLMLWFLIIIIGASSGMVTARVCASSLGEKILMLAIITSLAIAIL